MASPAPDSDRLPRPAPKVVYQPVPDGAVLFAVTSETYFGLNKVGAEAWQMLPPVSRTLSELANRVAERHPEVDASMVRNDLGDLINELRRLGLVVDDESDPDGDDEGPAAS